MAIARLRRNIPHLKKLKKVPTKQRKEIISQASADLINCICDCCLNVVKGNLQINQTQKKKLGRHAVSIRALSKKGQSLKKRKQILIQKGGFLPALIAPVLSLAASVIGGLINQ